MCVHACVYIHMDQALDRPQDVCVVLCVEGVPFCALICSVIHSICTCAHTHTQPLYVRYEQFAIALDSHFGQLLWEDCPEVANKVFSELLGRILDLDVEFCGAIESDMVVSVFQYSSYFLEQGW